MDYKFEVKGISVEKHDELFRFITVKHFDVPPQKVVAWTPKVLDAIKFKTICLQVLK